MVSKCDFQQERAIMHTQQIVEISACQPRFSKDSALSRALCTILVECDNFLNFSIFLCSFISRVIGYFRQEFFIVFKFWLVGVALSVVVSFFIVIGVLGSYSQCNSELYCPVALHAVTFGNSLRNKV